MSHPAHEIRYGKVKATIWANETSKGLRYSVNVSRIYKDGEEEWKTSDSFGRDDIPLVCKALTAAQDWIFEQPK